MRDWMMAMGLCLGMVAPVVAQGTGPYTFRMVAGRDTVASDVVTRAATQVDVDMIYKGGGQHWHYTMTVAPDQRVTRITTAFYRLAAGDTVPFQSAVMDFVGDSVHVKISGNVERTEVDPTTAGAIPYINPSSAAIEQVLRRARAMGGAADTVTVPLFAVSGGQTIPVTVTWQGADSAVLKLAGVEMRAHVGPDGSLLGMTIPAQHATVTRLEGAHPLVTKPIDYGAPADAPYTAEDVTVHTSKGLSLTGTLTLPKARAGKVPAVVTITGSGAEDRDERLPGLAGYRPFWQIADTLGRRGIAVLRLDDRGVNGSSTGPSNATSADFANDIRAALAWLKTRPEIDGSRLGLVGHSEGGMIAPMVAATDPSLRGIVLMAGPAYTGRRIVEYQQRDAVEHAPSLTPEERKQALEQAEKETSQLAAKNAWLRFFMDYDPLETARKVRVPVLILQGETDHQVTPEQADTLAAAFRAGGDHDVTLRKFPDTDHLFLADSSGLPSGYNVLDSRSVRPEVLGTIADWLAGHLRK